MSIINSSTKFVGINPNFPTAERKSAQNNAAQEVVTMQDITDTVLSVSPTPPDPAPLAFANAATVGALSYSPTYNNGTSGVGATLTATVNGVLRDTSAVGKIDTSYTPVVGDVILIKNQSSGISNGLYVITTVGSVSTPYVLTRFTDFDQSAELYPLQVNVISGNSNALKYFIQTTTNPIVGTSNLIFSITSALQPVESQISFVDTVIDTQLSSIVYANGTAFPTVPGSGATLTSTVNGALGTYYGLTANTNSTIALGFTRVLLINQTNPAYNGDYQVINAGSASTKWQLRRIQSSASGFDRYTRYFVVSNAGSTKAGKIYFTKPNSPVLTNATIGTAAINIFEYGGSSFGPFGIANASGVYTYYATFTLAMAAAVSGQTIEMFANVTETGAVEITLKDGVNINGNGYTYTLNNSGSSNAFKVTNSTSINCSIINLNVIRTGSTGTQSANTCLYSGTSTSGNIFLTGSKFTNTGSGSGIAIGSASTISIYDGTAIANTTFGSIYIESSAGAKVYNSTGISTSQAGVNCYIGGDLFNCTGISSSGIGIDGAGATTAGNQYNCIGISSTGTGLTTGAVAINCIGRSTSGSGISSISPSKVYGCVGISVSGRGISNVSSSIYNSQGISISGVGFLIQTSTAILYNCLAKSDSSYSIWGWQGSKIYNSIIECNWNNSGGNGIQGISGFITNTIVNCVFKLSNATAPYLNNGGTAQDISMRGNTYQGGAAFNINLTQAIVAVEDAQGNIFL